MRCEQFVHFGLISKPEVGVTLQLVAGVVSFDNLLDERFTKTVPVSPIMWFRCSFWGVRMWSGIPFRGASDTNLVVVLADLKLPVLNELGC